jgi:hypothetical protein
MSLKFLEKLIPKATLIFPLILNSHFEKKNITQVMLFLLCEPNVRCFELFDGGFGASVTN